MKKILVYMILVLAVAFSCTTNNKNDANPGSGGNAAISFDKLEFDFGQITEGEKVACTFKYKNTGDGDLVINSATTSCGCTVPRFDDKPLPPGEEGSMEVVFDSSHREGAQTKTITVRSNAEVKVVVLRITAEVIK